MPGQRCSAWVAAGYTRPEHPGIAWGMQTVPLDFGFANPTGPAGGSCSPIQECKVWHLQVLQGAKKGRFSFPFLWPKSIDRTSKIAERVWDSDDSLIWCHLRYLLPLTKVASSQSLLWIVVVSGYCLHLFTRFSKVMNAACLLATFALLIFMYFSPHLCVGF